MAFFDVLGLSPCAESVDYVNTKQQFQLQSLLTEQRHPNTRNLSQAIRAAAVDGVGQILSVDHDISRMISQVHTRPLGPHLFNCVFIVFIVPFVSCPRFISCRRPTPREVRHDWTSWRVWRVRAKRRCLRGAAFTFTVAVPRAVWPSKWRVRSGARFGPK